MNVYTLKQYSTVKINKISELGKTAVNIVSKLFALQRKKITLHIREYETEIDLTKHRDVLNLCARLLIDEEFRPDFYLYEKRKPREKYYCGSKLDQHSEEIIKKLNDGEKKLNIMKEFGASHNCLFYWRKTRTKRDEAGKIILKNIKLKKT